MSKHTQGPWFADGARFVRQLNGQRHVICRLPTQFKPADQLLIAAAPELLEFAEEVRRSGDARLASMAIAVIAKVTGETQ